MMNRLKIKNLWPAIALGMLASCAADVEQEAQQGGAAIRLTAEEQTAAAPTRAASTADLQNTAFAAGEDVAVYVVDRASASTYASTPYRFRASAVDGAGQNALTYYSDATTASVLCYPITPSASVDIYGFYPYSLFASVGDRTTDDLAFSVSADQSTAAAYRASDVMMAAAITNQARTESTVNLQFSHLMAKLVVRLKQGVHAGSSSAVTAAELAGSTLTIGGVTTEATLDMTDGTVTTGSNSTTVTLASDADLAFYYSNSDAAISATEYAIVLPAQALTSANVVTITTAAGETISGILPAITLTAGSSTVLTLTVSDSGIEATRADYGKGGTKKWEIIPGAIMEEYSVSGSKKVYFSKGNLQYTTTGTHNVKGGGTVSGTWRFAEHQWDKIGSDNNNMSSTYEGWIDLYSWGASGESRQPYAAIGEGNNNGWSDWGVYNAISNGGDKPNMWHTLSEDEWSYLINTRSASTVNGTANARYAKATVNSVRGLILFPDSYTQPAGVTLPTAINSYSANYTSNSYSGDDWMAMETYGCVFLPVTGKRWTGSSDVEGLDQGAYWGSSSIYEGGRPWEPRGYGFGFTNSSLTGNYDRHCRYKSVRLVKTAQ